MKNLIYLSLIIGLVSCHEKTENKITKPKVVKAETPTELYKAIAHVDSLMISVAQRDCDLEAYASFLSEDFEYYHDKAGYTPSKEAEMKDMNIFCGKEQRSRQPLRRQRTEGTLKVFPMDNYGALEFCDHVFYLQINDGTEN